MTDRDKKLLIALGVVALGALVYFFVINGEGDSIISSSSPSDISSQAAVQTREFRNILNDLNTINLDSDLVKDPDFLRLRDNSRPVAPRTYGSRTNPFLITE